MVDVAVWHQSMQCWKPVGKANIFKDVAKKICVCVENGMANLILLCILGSFWRNSYRRTMNLLYSVLFSSSTCFNQ